MKFKPMAAVLAAVALSAAGTTAQEWPAKNVTLIVPFAAGGGIDASARVQALALAEVLKQGVIVENIGAAGGTVGTGRAAKAEPDGYTLLIGNSGTHAYAATLYKSLPYDPVKDLVPITMTNSYPYVLVVNSKLPANSLQEFVALGKAKPGSMNYGTTGVGAANHLMSELFCEKAGLKMTHIPYRGTAVAVADLVAGQVTMVFGDPVSVLPHMQAGTLRALAVSSPERSPVAPQVPTVAEGGYPGVEAVAWHGIFAPARTPTAIVETLHAEIVKALRDPDIKALLSKQAMQPVGDTPQEFAAFIPKDIATWKEVATAANVSVE